MEAFKPDLQCCTSQAPGVRQAATAAGLCWQGAELGPASTAAAHLDGCQCHSCQSHSNGRGERSRTVNVCMKYQKNHVSLHVSPHCDPSSAACQQHRQCVCMLQAVIGAGAAGLVAVKELRREGHRVTVFEQSDDIGGVWRCLDLLPYRSSVSADMQAYCQQTCTPFVS